MALTLLTSAAEGETWGPPAGANPAYSVIYTGRLFGYFRFPDIQTSGDRGCPDPARTPLPRQVELFRATLERMRADRQSLVSMGENFAPELLARAVKNTTPGTPHYGEMVSKDVLSGEEGKLASDNVACFLRLMKFDAIVPGQQDFYYGPERLRQIANFLAMPAQGEYRPVRMISANLVIGSSLRDGGSPRPDNALPADIKQALGENAPVRFDLPSRVLPWLRTVTATGEQRNADVYDCLADPADPRNFQLPLAVGSRCTPLRKTEEGVVGFGAGSLQAGSNHALCAVYLTGGLRTSHCQLFSVEYPFFEAGPYFAPADRGSAVVFGALDPALVGYIGQLNDVWVNTDTRFDTRAEVTDPVEALREALTLCDSDSNCRGRRKILLAQMPNDRAAQLAAKLKSFDMVIARPDQEHATGDESSHRRGANNRPYLLTPGITFDANRDEPLGTNLRRADYYVEADDQFVTNQIYDVTLPSHVKEPCRTCALSAEVAKATAQPAGPASAKAYEQLALSAMQKFCASDIALLQQRDVFGAFPKAVELWPTELRASPQQLLDETLWKGDFAFCVPVQGSTLKKVLRESAEYEKQDRDDLSMTVEKGRGLSTLGIEIDATTGEPSVRGQPVQDNRLYGVAMTDYLAFGNTGYPEFSTEAVEPVVRLVFLKALNRVTGLACEQLPAASTAGSCQTDEIPAAEYFSAIEQRPFDTSRGLTPLARVSALGNASVAAAAERHDIYGEEDRCAGELGREAWFVVVYARERLARVQPELYQGTGPERSGELFREQHLFAALDAGVVANQRVGTSARRILFSQICGFLRLGGGQVCTTGCSEFHQQWKLRRVPADIGNQLAAQ